MAALLVLLTIYSDKSCERLSDRQGKQLMLLFVCLSLAFLP